MNRREASKKETRRLILEAARKLLAREGGEDCTIKAIAAEAGVSPASVVVHFKSKVALFEEALYGDIEKTRLELLSTMPQDAPLLHRLMHFWTGFLTFYDGNRNLYRILIRSTIFEPVGETPHMSRQAEQYTEFLIAMVEEEKARGAVRPEVDSHLAAASIFSLYMGALTLFLRVPEMTVAMITQMLSAMTAQFLQGIAGRSQ
jgi:AcrR family transcriptional regulator